MKQISIVKLPAIMTRFGVLICLCMLNQNLHAAKISDAAYVEYKLSQQSNRSFETKDDSTLNIKESEYDIKAKFGAPLYASTEGHPIYVFLNLNYELLSCNYKINTSSSSLKSIDKLHTIGSGLGAFVVINKNLSMNFSLGGSLNSNLNKIKRVDQNDLLVNANMVFIKTYNISSFQYGLTISSSFGKPMILPILGFTIKPVEWFQYSIMIPYQTSAWLIGSKFSLGLTAQIDGKNYRLIRDDEANDYTLSRTSIETSTSLRYNIWKQFYTYADVCYLVKQSMTMNYPDGTKYSDIDYSGSMSERISLRLGLAYSY